MIQKCLIFCLVLSKIPSIKRVFLDKNSIICDERLSDFAGEFNNESSNLYQIVMPNDLRCSLPPDSRGKSLASIDYKSLPKNDGTNTLIYRDSYLVAPNNNIYH